MKQLHDLKIAHRDLKPYNILVNVKTQSDEVECKITDFGESRIFEDVTPQRKLTTMIGTTPYMSEEMLDERGAYSDEFMRSAPEEFMRSAPEEFAKKGDVYSYGIMANEIFSGKKPYLDAKNQYNLMLEIVENQKRPVIFEKNESELHKVIEKLIKQCWSHEDTRPVFTDIVSILEVVAFLAAHKIIFRAQIPGYTNIWNNYIGRLFTIKMNFDGNLDVTTITKSSGNVKEKLICTTSVQNCVFLFQHESIKLVMKPEDESDNNMYTLILQLETVQKIKNYLKLYKKIKNYLQQSQNRI